MDFQNQNEQPLVVPVPSGKAKVSGKVIFFVILVVVLLVTTSLLYKSLYGQKSVSKPTNTAQGDKPTLSQIQTTFTKDLKFNFPLVTKSKNAAVSDLPKILSFLIPKEATSIQVQAITFQNDSSGYNINYNIQNNDPRTWYVDFHMQASASGFTVLADKSRPELIFDELESSDYQMHASLIKADKNLNVKLIVLKK